MRLIVDMVAPADVTVEVRPLLPRPFDFVAWRHGLAGTIALRGTITRDGWPMELGSDGNRLVALYQMIEFVGAVVVRGVTPANAAAVEALLLAVRPDWASDEIVALGQLWE